MSISRRRFLRAGSVAALAAAVPLKAALVATGQGTRKGLDGNPSDRLPDEIANGPLSYYTKSAFSAYLNSTFLVQASAFGTIEVTLTQVIDFASGNVANQAGQECFSLLFKNGDGAALPQGTYGVEHAALGAFALLLVPGGADDNGRQSYVAVINRLENSPMLFAAQSGTVKTGATRVRSAEKVSTPANATPSAMPVTLQNSKRSWKRGDEDKFAGPMLIDQ